MELDRLVPNSIMSGGPEDLNLIELLWKQDVDLGVGKEVYDHSLREQLEKQKEREYFKHQEKIKAQVAAREKEERSKQEEASRWLNQNYSRDGETGEWVKRQSTVVNKDTDSASGSLTVDENDEFLTLEAALDYMCTRVDSDGFQSDSVVPVTESFTDELSEFEPETNMQALLPAQHVRQNLCLENLPQPSIILENEWDQVESYLNASLNDPLSDNTVVQTLVTDEALPSTSGHEFDLDVKHDMLSGAGISGQSDLDNDIFTNANLPLIHDASLPSSDIEPVPELGAVTLTNCSVPPQPCVMNTSLDWESGNMSTIFGNLSALEESNIDDIELENMEDLFTTMTETTNLLNNVTSSDMDSLVVSRTRTDTVGSLPSTSFSDDLAEAFDGLEGATGGADYSGHDGLDTPYRKISRLSESSSDSGFAGKGGFSSSSSSASSYSSSPSDSSMGYHNNLTNSNDTDHDPHGTKALAHQVAHNHTYNTLPGHVPREVKKYAPKPHSKKGPQCRDAKKAQELKIPLTVDEIVDSPVETFNDLLTKYSLTEDQLTLIRDIRRRGKNKLAAQNCRKRKVGVIVTLSDEMSDLQKARDRLMEERAEMERETRRMREKFGHLYTHIFQSLRDEHGQPYDPSLYSLQQSSDGNVFLVPRNVTTTTDINGNGDGNMERNSRFKKRRSDN